MPKATIRYGASLTVPNPRIPYSNVKPTLELEVDLDDAADRDKAFADIREWVHAGLGTAVDELDKILESRS
jgi:hypothetical protein